MKKNNYLFIIIFIFFIYIPSITFFITRDFINTGNNENRVLSQKPELSIKTIASFPKSWDNYYNDNLPYRYYIVNAWRNINYLLLKNSIDKNVIIGKNNGDVWLFFDNENDGDEISYIDGRKKLNIKELNNTIEIMKDETNKLKNKDIDIYYIIGPNKSTVYSNYLPRQIKVKENYTENAVKYMKDNNINNIFYSPSTLKKASKKYETYYRTDTHWNSYGTYEYIKEFLKSIYNEDIELKPNINYKIDYSSGRDLHNFTGISLKIKDNEAKISYSNNKDISIKKETKDYGTFTVYDNKNYSKDETILLYGDSFGDAVIQHLIPIYKRVVHLRTLDSKYDEKILEDYKPNKIFYIRVERTIPNSFNTTFTK